MLLQDYAFYFYRILLSGLLTPVGILAIVLLIGAFSTRFFLTGNRAGLKRPVFWAAFCAGLICISLAFYAGIYEFDEQPETLVFATLPEGEPNCGNAWSAWIKSGYGLNKTCPDGCYRGLVSRKQMRMGGFPPWPEYRRELQCWKREDP